MQLQFNNIELRKLKINITYLKLRQYLSVLIRELKI